VATLNFGERTVQMLIKAAAQAKANPKLTSDLTPEAATELSREIWGNKVIRGFRFFPMFPY
jgi:hypothetical protein